MQFLIVYYNNNFFITFTLIILYDFSIFLQRLYIVHIHIIYLLILLNFNNTVIESSVVDSRWHLANLLIFIPVGMLIFIS
jgi:hypothetical protein